MSLGLAGPFHQVHAAPTELDCDWVVLAIDMALLAELVLCERPTSREKAKGSFITLRRLGRASIVRISQRAHSVLYHGTIVPGYGTVHRLIGAGLDESPRFRGWMAVGWEPCAACDVATGRKSLGFRAVTAGFGTCGNLLSGR
jgi:hypothetical protein